MPTYRRKDWIKEAIGISIALHIVLIFLSYFFTIKPVQEVFYVTMYQEQDLPTLIDKQPVKAKPLPTSSELDPEVPEVESPADELAIREDVEHSLSEIRSLLQSNSQIRNKVQDSKPLEDKILADDVTTSEVVDQESKEPTRPVSPPVPPRSQPVVERPSSSPKIDSAPSREVPKAPPVTPSKPVIKEEPVPTTVEESKPKEPVSDVEVEDKESITSETEEVNKEDGTTSLGEEWDFLTKGSGNDSEIEGERIRSEAVGEALYSMQFASRRVVKAPDFSFLESGKFYTNSAFIRVRLSILADGSVIQAVLVDSGSGDSELDRLILEGLLGMIFNDVSAQRSTTQIGVITIRFS